MDSFLHLVFKTEALVSQRFRWLGVKSAFYWVWSSMSSFFLSLRIYMTWTVSSMTKTRWTLGSKQCIIAKKNSIYPRFCSNFIWIWMNLKCLRWDTFLGNKISLFAVSDKILRAFLGFMSLVQNKKVPCCAEAKIHSKTPGVKSFEFCWLMELDLS